MIVKIERLDDFGRGIALIDGKITFVSGAYTGDTVKIDIIENKKKYNVAVIKEVIKRGNIYQNNGCKNPCGGCNLLISDNNEINYKENLIKSFFKDCEIKSLVSLNRLHYRNKITLRYDKVLGLYEEKTNNIVEVNDCLLVTDAINKTIGNLKSILNGFNSPLEIIIKDLNGIMIYIKGNFKKIEKLKNIADVLYINDICYTEQKYLEFNDLFIGPNSFFQVNNEISKELYDEILLNLNKNDKVLDLYSGVGSISKHISNKVNKVLGIEIVKEAVDLANMIDNEKLEFRCGNVEDYLSIFKEYNVAIIDPPRAGLSKAVTEKLNNTNLDKIIYISCNIRTLKRDIDLLTNYKIKYVRGFNMFFYTHHLEVLVILERKEKIK